MKLAIKDLSKALVKDIENVLSTSQKTNVISITNEIIVGVGEYVLHGDDINDIDFLNLAQILSIEDVRDVYKKHLRESKIPPNKYKNLFSVAKSDC